MKQFQKFIPAATLASIVASIFLFGPPSHAQKDKKPVPPPQADVSRTTTRHENHRLPYGGTVTISGAPAGSITIEGWSRSEVDITAEIELHAPSAADLDRIAVINNFGVDVDTNHVRIITASTADKKLMKQLGKNFPRALLNLPWKVDFHLKVPAMTDLEIDSGVGPLKLAGVEGAIRLNALQSDADLSLTGGFFMGVIQRGTVAFRIPARSWHGPGASMQLAGGALNVLLMPGFSGDIDATVLRLGEIKNSYPDLQPREGSSSTPRSLSARAGAGGARISFTVGDGTLGIKQEAQ